MITLNGTLVVSETRDAGRVGDARRWSCRRRATLVVSETRDAGRVGDARRWSCRRRATLVVSETRDAGRVGDARRWSCRRRATLVVSETRDAGHARDARRWSCRGRAALVVSETRDAGRVGDVRRWSCSGRAIRAKRGYHVIKKRRHFPPVQSGGKYSNVAGNPGTASMVHPDKRNPLAPDTDNLICQHGPAQRQDRPARHHCHCIAAYTAGHR